MRLAIDPALFDRSEQPWHPAPPLPPRGLDLVAGFRRAARLHGVHPDTVHRSQRRHRATPTR